MAVIDGRPSMFKRDSFGSAAPMSMCPYPPLELATAAALLRDAGITPDLVAANVRGWRHEKVAAHLRETRPDVVLIPSAWQTGDDDLSLIRLLRHAVPHARFLLSGPNVSADPERFLVEDGPDACIVGEPEEAVLLVSQGEPFKDVPNLVFKAAGSVTRTESRFPPDWPSYPLPARDLLDLSAYWIPFSKRLPSTTLETARGCLHTCNFCPTQLWHKRTVRPRSVAHVLKEIDELVTRYGMRELIIKDDTFTWDRARVVAICEGLIARGHDLTWRCFATVSTVDRELLRLMAKAGCVQVCYGFESGDDRVLKRTGKGTTVAQGRDAARWTREAGLELSGTFMVGYEGETPEMLENSIAFAIDNRLDYVQVTPATPLPGTAFGRHKPTADGEAVRAEVRRFHRRFYLRPGYVARRLFSGRELDVLLKHAELGLRVAAYAVMGWGYDPKLSAGKAA